MQEWGTRELRSAARGRSRGAPSLAGSERQARESLKRAANAMAVGNLTAVQEEKTFGVWHHFYNSPFNVTALAALARWLHPEEFNDLDADALLADFYQDFQPVAFQGTYWVAGQEDEPAASASARSGTP